MRHSIERKASDEFLKHPNNTVNKFKQNKISQITENLVHSMVD